jgi:vitamin K-dependent gamma-carboxylase
MDRARQLASGVWRAALAPTDAAGLVVFRVLFGVLACVIPLRFMANGWVERFYVEPTFFFSYWGFEWIAPLPAPWMQLVFVAMAVAGAMIAIGFRYRAFALSFFVLFTYVELIDVTTYLNHYYLVSLLALLLAVMPRAEWHGTIPAWCGWLLRFQVAVVYVFAALAKVSGDWLLHAQPLSLWLGARMDTPVVGPFFDRIEVAYLMSWGGFLYDLTIPLWLSWRRTRGAAFVVLLGFHSMTHVLFDIGMFPVIMTVAAVVFVDPGMPRRIAARLGLRRMAGGPLELPSAGVVPAFGGWHAAGATVVVAWCLFHVAMPLRSHAYGRNVLWDEQGMRWSWRMLCREKTGAVTYRVRARGWEGEREVSPRTYLTLDQETEMVGQPDMILQLAHHVRDDLVARGERDVEVRVDARASLNGRRSAILIDPEVDLARVADSLGDARWILPEPEGPPARLTTPALAGLE